MQSLLDEQQEELIVELIPQLEGQIRAQLLQTFTPLYQVKYYQKLKQINLANFNSHQHILAQAQTQDSQLLAEINAELILIEKQITQVINDTQIKNKESVLIEHILRQQREELLTTRFAGQLQEQINASLKQKMEKVFSSAKSNQFKQLYVAYRKKLQKEQTNILKDQEEFVNRIEHCQMEIKRESSQFARLKSQTNVELKNVQQEIELLKSDLRDVQSYYNVQVKKIQKDARAAKNKPISPTGQVDRIIRFYGDQLMSQRQAQSPMEESAQVWTNLSKQNYIPNQLKTDMRVYLDLTALRQKLLAKNEQVSRANKISLPIKTKDENFEQKYKEALKGITKRSKKSKMGN